MVIDIQRFVKPDKNFIENYTSIVPDITELANYNIGIGEADLFAVLGECLASVILELNLRCRFGQGPEDLVLDRESRVHFL